MIQKELRPRILIVVNVEWYFWSHRLALAKALRDYGCTVIVAASVERGYQRAIEQEGFRFVPLHLQRRSTNPWRELASLRELFYLYRQEQPALVHHVAIKPVLYGSIAAKAAKVPAVINAVTGLGYTFLRSGISGRALRQITSLAYRVALSGKSTRAIFQNPDDLNLFVSIGAISPERAVLIRGAGVNIHEFKPSPEPLGVPVVLLASRLLWDKGVGELVEASRRLRNAGTLCRVILVGAPDPENPESIPDEVIRGWQFEGIIEWWGLRADMAEVMAAASIVVLPSYREGVPRVLLEAAASGRTIVTTDVPGCREIVRHGENGLLVPPRDAKALAEAIGMLLNDPVLRAQMGACGREIAEAEFSEEQVIQETLVLYRDLLGQKWRQRV